MNHFNGSIHSVNYSKSDIRFTCIAVSQIVFIVLWQYEVPLL